jgi:hypothetical protein
VNVKYVRVAFHYGKNMSYVNNLHIIYFKLDRNKEQAVLFFFLFDKPSSLYVSPHCVSIIPYSVQWAVASSIHPSLELITNHTALSKLQLHINFSSIQFVVAMIFP